MLASCWVLWTDLTKSTQRVVQARTVHRVPAGQRGDARHAKSNRGAPWQPNPAEVAEGEPLGVAQTGIVSVAMVPIEHRLAFPVMGLRECEARRFYIW